jgi:hypothetical protein
MRIQDEERRGINRKRLKRGIGVLRQFRVFYLLKIKK